MCTNQVFLLEQETGFYFYLEDGGFILLEDGYTSDLFDLTEGESPLPIYESDPCE